MALQVQTPPVDLFNSRKLSAVLSGGSSSKIYYVDPSEHFRPEGKKKEENYRQFSLNAVSLHVSFFSANQSANRHELLPLFSKRMTTSRVGFARRIV